MTKYFYYNYYGLNIKSQINFPELNISTDFSDIIIRFSEKDEFVIKSFNNGTDFVKFSENDIIYLYNNNPLIRVKSGLEIIINSDINISLNFLRSMILAKGMSILLYQRGYLIFHGTAVNINGNGVAFLGDCGMGKSTIAAALVIRGHGLLTDDVLVIDFDKNNNTLVLPSFPRIKLWDDVIKLVPNKNKFSRIHPLINKYSYNFDDYFYNTPIILKSIYIIENGTNPGIISMNSRDALIELIKNYYLGQLFSIDDQSLNMIKSTKVLRKTSVKVLKRTNSLDDIDEIVKILELDNLK